MITSNMPNASEFAEGENIIITCRIHRMEPDSSANLDRFLEAFRLAGRYVLFPTIMGPGGPKFISEFAIGKHKLSVKHAKDVGPGDMERMALRTPTK